MTPIESIEFNTAKAMRQNHMMASNGKDNCNCHYCTLARAIMKLLKEENAAEKSCKCHI